MQAKQIYADRMQYEIEIALTENDRIPQGDN